VRSERYDKVMDPGTRMLHGQYNQLTLPAVIVSVLIRAVLTVLKNRMCMVRLNNICTIISGAIPLAMEK
jgi:hypothetical protein